MFTVAQKESRRFGGAAKNMFRVTDWLLGRSNNNFQALDRAGYHMVCDAVGSGETAKLVAVLDHLHSCGLFDDAYGFERLIYAYLNRCIGTVLPGCDKQSLDAARKWLDNTYMVEEED